MSLLPLLLFATGGNQHNQTAKVINTICCIITIALLALAIFLAIKDMSNLNSTSSKIWLFLLAIFVPELYVLLHGLASSVSGVGFFDDAIIDVPTTPMTTPAAHLSAAATEAASSLKKAAGVVKSGAQKTASAAKSEAQKLPASVISSVQSSADSLFG